MVINKAAKQNSRTIWKSSALEEGAQRNTSRRRRQMTTGRLTMANWITL
jgi:hypothetical protein